MKAIRQYEFGEADTLRYEDVPDPEPGPGQVRVRVAVAGAHLVDTTLRRGSAEGPPLPDLPTISETVPGVTMDGWFVLVAPAGVPTDIVTRMTRRSASFSRATKSARGSPASGWRRAAPVRRRAPARSSPASRRSGARWRRSLVFSRSDQAGGLCTAGWRAVFSAIQRTAT